MGPKPIAAEIRFWFKVLPVPSGCWEWQGGKAGEYGKFQNMRAHCFAYALCTGPIPAGMVVRHSCDNPPCVNPAHLSLGTQLDNMRDMVARGRHRSESPAARLARRTHCQRGHLQEGRNVRLKRRKDSSTLGRVCRVCELERLHRYRGVSTEERACA